MAALIDTIVLPKSMARYRCGSSEWRDPRLGPLGKINIFVGANNTGKSWAMRLLCGDGGVASEYLPRLDTWSPPETYHRHNVVSLFREIDGLLKRFSIEPPKEFTNEFNQILKNLRENGTDIVLTEALRFLALTSNLAIVDDLNKADSYLAEFNRHLTSLGFNRFQHLEQNIAEFRAKPAIDRLYIPTLRTLRPIGIETGLLNTLHDSAPNRNYSGDLRKALTDIFQQLTHRQYFNYKHSQKITIFSGQTLYDDIENLLRGDLKSRQKLQEFEAFLSQVFFQNKHVALIPRKGHDEVTIRIGNEEERPIHQVGDGIQMLLLLTYPLFQRSDERVLAFIEEPELFLHPWLQRVLVELLASNRFPNHQYFITTHSNHLLDLAMDVNDVSVFSFEKELSDQETPEQPAKFRISNVSRDDRKPLDLLGVRNSSVLLSNCTIWVEGITDRRYLSHWLDLYQEKLRQQAGDRKITTYHEDLHFSFVEYGGGNITHWSFLDDTPDPIDVKRLCGTLFLITDSDSAKNGKKAERHKKLGDRLGDNYRCLPVREIENLLSPGVLKSVLAEFGEEKASLPDFKQTDYEEQFLGTFIEDVLLKNGTAKKRKGSYKADSGTITEKVKFCELANAAISKWEDLSEPAQKLVERLYGFIEANNKGR